MALNEKMYILDDVSRELNVDRDTIVRWEDLGKIPFKVQRNNVGWRVFTREQIDILKEIMPTFYVREPVKKKKKK